MPYKSDAQRRYLHAKEPALAARWDKLYKSSGDLPEHVKKRKVKRRKRKS